MMHARGRERLHRRGAALLAEVARVVVGEAQHVEACRAVVIRVAARRAEQVTGLRVAALLARFAAVDEDAFQVAEGDIGGPEPRRHAGEEPDAVVVGQVILGVIRAEHHVADRGDTYPDGRAADGLGGRDRHRGG